MESYEGGEIETVHQVTTALKAIPQEELRHYSVEADIISYQGTWDEQGSTWISQYRDAGEASAQDWLRGDIVLEYWSAWYASWLENVRELQETYKK